jgi:hypothetical protein
MAPLSQWRTVVVVLALALAVLAALWLCRGAGDLGARLFPDAAYALLGLAVVAAGKSAVEHLGAGGGVKGALRALLTDAKPGDPAPAPPPGTAP